MYVFLLRHSVISDKPLFDIGIFSYVLGGFGLILMTISLLQIGSPMFFPYGLREILFA
jgi:hypothetical protein